MSKPPFNPDQPFTSAKPAFDPNAPFTAVGQPQQGVLGAVSAALDSRPELKPFAYQPSPAQPVSPISGALNAAGQTLAAPIRMGQTLSAGPQATGEAIAETGGELGYPKTGVALGAIPAMAPFVMGAVGEINGLKRPPAASTQALIDFADKLKQSASSRFFKAAGGTLSNAKELGADEALRLGRLARDGGYLTPLNSSDSQSAAIKNDLQTSGKRMEELRGLGNLYGDSPESSKLVQIITQDLGPKYGPGIRQGESGDLQKAIAEVLKLEPIDKLTPSEELAGNLKNATRLGDKTSDPMGVYPHAPGSSLPQDQYESFRAAQEDPNYIPEYDLRRPTTFNEVAKVATDINTHAKGQSKLLQPTGALTDAANVISKTNNESLLSVLPPEKGAEYQQNLNKYHDLSILDRMNELKQSAEVGGSRNSIVNNIANRIFHRFGYQLSGEALDKISNLLRTTPNVPVLNPLASNVALRAFVDKVTTRKQGN